MLLSTRRRSISVALQCAGKLTDDVIDQVRRLDDACVGTPFEHPRDDGLEIHAAEREPQPPVRLLGELLGLVPLPCADVRSFRFREVDHDALRDVAGFGEMDAEVYQAARDPAR